MMNRYKLTDWASSIGICLAHIGNYIYIPLLLSKLGGEYSGFWAGFVLFMTYVGRVSATFCYRSISSKYAMRYVISLFVLLEGIALLGMGFFETRFAYSFLAYFVGFGSGISFPALKHLLSGLPEKLRLSAFSRFQLAAQSGLILGAVIGGFWSEAAMTNVFVVTFLLFVGYAAVIYFLFPPYDELANANKTLEPKDKVPFFDFTLLKSANFPEIKYDLLLSLFYWILIMGFTVNIPLFIQSYMPSLKVSMPFWLTGSVLLFLQMPLSKRAEKILGTSNTMASGCFALLIAFICLSLYPSILCLVVGCVMLALGQILFAPALDLHVSRSVGKENMGKAMSSMHFYRSFGNMIGCFSAGILFDFGKSMHRYNLSWIVMALVALFLAISCIGLARSKVSRTVEVH